MSTNPPPVIPGGHPSQGHVFPLRAWGEPERPETEEEIIRRRDEERRARLDLVDVLVEEHRTITELLAELAAPETPVERRADVAEVVVAELSRHLTVERRHLYPTVEEALPDGARLAADAAEVDHTLQESLRTLRALPPALGESAAVDHEFAHVVRELTGWFARHTDSQEPELFPRLREACDVTRLRDLAWRARATHEAAPSRPHPHVPERGPVRNALDPIIGAADKIRDEVSRRPTDPADLDAPATGEG